MRSAALQRLESLLQTRKLDRALTQGLDSGRWPVSPTGIEALDRALGGGWRHGEVSELAGGRSSGRTSVLMTTLACATRRGGLIGLVDTFDRFDPITAARAGIDLDRVLWVRGPSVTVESARPAMIDHAVRQAIRALDLIVRAGGFAIAALDLADVSLRGLRGLPLTTWMRLAHANEGRDTVCLLAGDMPMGRSARGASVRLEASKRWSGRSAQARRFAGFEMRAHVVSARTTDDKPHWVLGSDGPMTRWPDDAMSR
jgi:hypothetical protein